LTEPQNGQTSLPAGNVAMGVGAGTVAVAVRVDAGSLLGVSVARLISNSSASANGSCITGRPRDVGGIGERGSPATALRDFEPACFGMTNLYVTPLAIGRSVSEKRAPRPPLSAATLSAAAASGNNRSDRGLDAM
jgi:hypothetical protein